MWYYGIRSLLFFPQGTNLLAPRLLVKFCFSFKFLCFLQKHSLKIKFERKIQTFFTLRPCQCVFLVPWHLLAWLCSYCFSGCLWFSGHSWSLGCIWFMDTHNVLISLSSYHWLWNEHFLPCLFLQQLMPS